ncbi:aldehyde dehydrogenase family protein [Prauserella flavalba]|uniref:aldehyde dehydrogenase family protein n=1 Tax=Prauserella flavalba TaxID=1477506 RepID=UPI000D770FF6
MVSPPTYRWVRWPTAAACKLSGGHRIGETGNFFQPTVLADTPTSPRAMNEEPFGPIAMVNRFSDIDNALEQSHRLDVGLAAYAFTGALKTHK